MANQRPDRLKAAEIVRDAGGRIVGRTRLQKVAYLLELAGYGAGFRFEYRHYGPYSEELASAIDLAGAFGLVKEDERRTEWGGVYSIYTVSESTERPKNARAKFAEEAAALDSLELELLATAAYLRVVEGYEDPWRETARRKPDKANATWLEKAKRAYQSLLEMKTERKLPQIV